jgi:hypothetical protein
MSDSVVTKLAMNLPWLMRYPFWRLNERLRRGNVGVQHLIIVVANHFEPGYNEEPNDEGGLGIVLDWDTQQRRLEDWCKQARAIGEAVRDHDNTPFRHTNFYPAEQYHRGLLDQLADLQRDGLGEVEIHLHHGVDQPDTADNFRQVLETFRDTVAFEHGLLSYDLDSSLPRYAFVHGNWALANSAGGRWCGVDNEMRILKDSGCYADLTLPSAPHVSQVSRINAIYTCGNDLDQRMSHRSGPSVRVGVKPDLPVMLTGPLFFDWSSRKKGVVPRLDNSALTAKYHLTSDRLQRMAGARISVEGQPDWVFIKLYCHGFFDLDQPAVIGEDMKRVLLDSLEAADRTGKFKLHFATARESFNMIIAAVDGHAGEPGQYRDYRLKQIMTRELAEKAVRTVTR